MNNIRNILMTMTNFRTNSENNMKSKLINDINNNMLSDVKTT